MDQLDSACLGTAIMRSAAPISDMITTWAGSSSAWRATLLSLPLNTNGRCNMVEKAKKLAKRKRDEGHRKVSTRWFDLRRYSMSTPSEGGRPHSEDDPETCEFPVRYATYVDQFLTRSSGLKHHCVKDVRKTAKKAKTFELQKLVKKLKGLRYVASDSDRCA